MFSFIKNILGASNDEPLKQFEVWRKTTVRGVFIVQERAEVIAVIFDYGIEDAMIKAKKMGGYAVPVIE